MSISIIDGFEVIDINHRATKTGMFIAGRFNFDFEHVFNAARFMTRVSGSMSATFFRVKTLQQFKFSRKAWLAAFPFRLTRPDL